MDNSETNGHRQTQSHIEKLAIAIDTLTESIEDFKDYVQTAVPIRVVIYMFLTLIVSIAGIKGTEFFFGTYLPKVMAESGIKP